MNTGSMQAHDQEKIPPKSLWNSLEIAKLAIGSLTPIVLAAFGIFLSLDAERRANVATLEAEKRSEDREIAAQSRTFKWQEQAEKREENRAAENQEASRKLALQMADLAAQREDLGRQRAFAAEAEIRRRAEQRDDAVRDQTFQLDKYRRESELRLRIWDDLGPRLNDIYAYSMRLGDWKRYTAADIVRFKREADRLYFSYEPIWGKGFSAAYDDFMRAVFATYSGEGKDAMIRVSPEGRNDPEPFRFDPAYSNVLYNQEIARANTRLISAAAEAIGVKPAAAN